MRLAVFDVDGTLIDSQGEIVAAMTAAFAAAGLPPPAAEAVRRIVGLSLPIAVATLGVPEALQRTAVDAYRAAWRPGTAPLFPGIAAMLEGLAARPGWRMAIATGKSRRGVRAIMAAHGWDGLFAAAECADGHPSKPHPAMLRAACDAAGVAPADAVMIGDTTFDMDMARAAGTAAWGVAWGYHPAGTLRADRIFARADELAAAFA